MLKRKYIKRVNNKWERIGESAIKHIDPDREIRQFTDKEAMLLNLKQETLDNLLMLNKRTKRPHVIIIEDVDGVGKSTVVNNLINKFREHGLKVRFNTFKRRRSDKPIYSKPSMRYEWQFRKEVVEQINRRMVEYDNEDIIILDKSPYCEYAYQKTQSFDRGLITPYGNHKMEIEIFKYKDIIDNAIVIFLENDQCWENYIGRETKSNQKGEKSSYNTLNKEEYMDMVAMFKKWQVIYENKNKYKAIKIQNDQNSWKRVYNSIVQILRNE